MILTKKIEPFGNFWRKETLVPRDGETLFVKSKKSIKRFLFALYVGVTMLLTYFDRKEAP